MKKLLILFLILAGCAVQPKDRAIQTIGVGTVANDGTGDKLRNAMIKVNSNFSYHEAQILLRSPILNPVFTGLIKLSTDTIPTYPQVRTELNDTMTARIAAATPINTIAPLWTDTVSIVATKSDIANIEGSGGGSTATIDELEFIIGYTTGAPAVGDSLLTHTNFIGKHLEIFRGPSNSATYSGGLRQKENPIGAANPKDGFRKNNSTGQVIFRPVFVDGELVSIESTNTIIHNSLSIEGEESVLLDDLLAYWQLDETIGSTSNEEVGGYNANTTGLVGQSGQIGLSVHYSGTQGSQVSHNAALVPAGDALTLGMWFKLDSLGSVMGRSAELMAFKHSASPWNSMELMLNTSDKLYFYIKNTGATSYAVYSTDAFDAGDLDTWIHVAVVCTASGSALKMYVNGDDVSATPGTFTGTFYQHDSGLAFGNEYNGGTNAIEGYIDEPFIYNVALSEADIEELMIKTYPFN